MAYFEKSDQLYKAFNNENSLGEYQDYTPANSNDAIGFYVKRAYPSDIRYRPPRDKDNKPDVVAAISIYYYPYELKQGNDKVPIYLRIGAYSKYLATHTNYKFDDTNCPTKESVQESKLTPEPISLESTDEYFIDHTKNALVDSKENICTGKEILDKFFMQHCDTVHIFKGFPLRLKMGLRNKAIKICNLLVQLGQFTLKFFFGRSLEPQDPHVGSLKTYKKEDIILSKKDEIDVFGYRASKHVILTFCVLILLLYIIRSYLGLTSKYLDSIFDNYLITLAFSIFLIWFLDYVCPLIVLKFTNYLIRFKLRLMFKKLKILYCSPLRIEAF